MSAGGKTTHASAEIDQPAPAAPAPDSRDRGRLQTGRLRDLDGAAAYLNCSVRTVARLIEAGQLRVVRLPVERDRKGNQGRVGTNRRKLVDVHDLDALIDANKE